MNTQKHNLLCHSILPDKLHHMNLQDMKGNRYVKTGRLFQTRENLILPKATRSIRCKVKKAACKRLTQTAQLR